MADSCCSGTPTRTPKIENGLQVIESTDPRVGILVVEAFPKPGGPAVGTSLNPALGTSDRPDLWIETDRPRGNGSTFPPLSNLCDIGIGGIAAVSPPRFTDPDPTPNQNITYALQDAACRFFVKGPNPGTDVCTRDAAGNLTLLAPSVSTHQFCSVLSSKDGFPSGDTTVTVQLRAANNGPLGPTAQIIVRILPTPTPSQ
ncbi:MAG TPA: hypothetical protein VMW17_24025 [Candidatus Binatia bacterium]|nr:hypothetical protein [Candidatus Binatia bacterium]